MPDKYTATWVSHSSISDYLSCPRSYFLKNVYRDPQANKKIKLMTPALALGQAVHETLEALSTIKTEERFALPLPERFARAWEKVTGKRGGFWDEVTEAQYRRRGADMIARVYNHPGPVGRLAVKIQDDLPHFWLSEEENIILCGKIDWLEYLPEPDSVRIIDFKTGRGREHKDSLQLPIYHLLVDRCQKRKVAGASYWYLETDDNLTDKELPPLPEAERQALAAARQVKLARQLKKLACPNGSDGCGACAPYERILKNEGERVGADDFGALIFILPSFRDAGQIPAAESLVL